MRRAGPPVASFTFASPTTSIAPEGGTLSRLATFSNPQRSEEHTSELQSQSNLVCRLLLEKKKITIASGAWRATSRMYSLLPSAVTTMIWYQSRSTSSPDSSMQFPIAGFHFSSCTSRDVFNSIRAASMHNVFTVPPPTSTASQPIGSVIVQMAQQSFQLNYPLFVDNNFIA